MQQEESIYNLIPRKEVKVRKAPRYRSKYDPKAPVVGSTFAGSGTTALPGAGLGGDSQTIQKKKGAGGFGPGLGKSKPDPRNFMKKQAKTVTGMDLAKSKPSKFAYRDSDNRKPGVPKKDDKPVMGLQSTKNFVTANAVESILAVPGNRARPSNDVPVYRNKVDYGKVPSYLANVKQEIEQENQMIEEYVKRQEMEGALASEDPHEEEISNEERDELLDALKTKWDAVNSKYQKMCHMVKLDTIGKVRRKEQMEAELTQLEKDIEMLEDRTIIIR
jgi:hypothetical protein